MIGKAISESDRLYFSSVRNQIVCIDDLERRGTGLTVRDVLGLISFLKEQRECKVILLLNDGELGESDREFRENFEKVFDSALRFMPSADESVRIVLENDDDTSQKLRQNCIDLGISNIRVISKIRRFALMLEQHLEGLSKEVVTQVLSSLALFCFCQFLPKAAPSIDYILNGHLRGLMRLQAAEISEEENAWRAMLSAYGYTFADSLDKAILAGVQNGYFDGEIIKTEAEKIQDDQISRNAPLSKAWDLFRNSFEDNIEDVRNAMERGVLETKHRSVTNLDATIRLLKELGFSEKAKVLIKDFVDNKEASLRYWDLSNHHGEVVVDPDVIAAFEQKRICLTVPPDTKQALLKIADRQGYDSTDVAHLASVSVEVLENVFKNARGEELENLIRGGLFFSRISNADDSMLEVTRRTKQALANISALSTLNALRVQNITGIASR